MSVINEAATLEAAGENRLEGIRQLIMRGKKLAFFERSCAIRLRSLTVLSLSNNSLRDLGSFEPLINLVEVNLNFNAIASLRGLTCPNLERLYLSNNLIASTERIESSFPKLRTLCLFKNIIPDLTSALEPLRGLPDLRWLDLDGNPCSQSRGYRHRVLRCCPRLLELDGEEIGQLDRDLSSLFFEEEKIRAAWESEGGVKIRRRTRPATAPAKGTSRTAIGGKRRQRQQLARAIAESATLAENEEGWEGVERGSQGAEALAKLARLPSGKLLRSDRLNNDPQLLCYLAQGVLADPCGSPRDAVETLRAASEEKRGRCGRGQLKEQVASATAASRQCPSGDGGHGEQREVGGENTGGPEETSREHDPGSRSPALHQGQLMAPPGGDLGVEENTGGEDRDISCLATRAGALIAGTEAATKTSTTGIGDADGGGATVSLPTSSTPREEVREDGETAASVPSADADRNQELLLPLPPPPLPPAADLDPSNPYATIRKLLKLVENLQLERARYVDGGGEDLKHHHYHVASTFPIVSGGNRSQQEEEVTDISTIVGDDNNSNSGEKQSDDDEDEGSASPPDPRTAGKKSRTRRRSSNRSNATRPRFDPGPPASREDVRRLRLENRNMHLLLVENRELKNQVREQSASAEGARRELATELGRVTGQLRGALRELQEARARLLLLRPAEASFSSPRGEEINSSRSTGSGVSNVAPALGLPASPPAVDVSAAETGTTALASSSASSCGGGTMSGGWSCSSSGSRATPMEWRRGRRRVPADSGEEEEEEEVTRSTAASTELRERNGMLIAINGVEHHPGEQISSEDGDGGGGGGGHDDDGGDEEGTDEELEELFRRNERTLGEIRHDLGLLAFGRARQDLDDVTTDSLQPAQDKHNNSTTNVLKRGEAGVKKQDFPWKTSAILPGEEAETQIGARLAKEHRPRTEGIPTSARKQVEPPGSLHRTKDKAPSSEPPSVSELLLQLRKDSTHNSSDKSNSIDGGSAVARGRADDTGDESREEALSSTKEENRGVAQDKRVEEGRVILVASNARSLLMS